MASNNNLEEKLPLIPDKEFFTISEVSELCKVAPHVLRYWEQEFAELKPSKREGRRYYQRKDIEIARIIKDLLYRQGFTIAGAQQRIKLEKQKSANPVSSQDIPSNPVKQEASEHVLKEMMVHLKSLLKELKTGDTQ